MANEKTPVVWDDTAKKHRPLGSGEKMGGLSASSMISSDSGNLLQQGSDGLMLVTGGSIADPRADNLLEESANGRLQVTADRIVEWLGLNPSDAEKIAEALAAKMAGELADGQTITASGGKLHSDPTNATAAQKAAINSALADADSGLVVDPSTGKLGVDFSNMPTDKFEELLKGLKMKVPLSANANVYVSINNSAAGDDIVDGRGTQAKPFRHIQAAVDYVTQTYALGSFNVYIRVAAGTYPENVTLPAYDAGTGRISISPDSGARDVVVQAQPTSQNYPGFCFTATGGSWNLYYMDARRVERPNSGTGGVGGCYLATGSGSSLYLVGCSAIQQMPSGNMGGNPYSVRLICADDGGAIRLGQGSLDGQISTQQPADMTTPVIEVLSIIRGGKLYLIRDNSASTSRDVNCSGSCKTFLAMWQNGTMNTGGIGDLIRFVDNGVTGKRYDLTGGSFVSGVGGDASFFPGSAGEAGTGTVESETYCWYK